MDVIHPEWQRSLSLVPHKAQQADIFASLHANPEQSRTPDPSRHTCVIYVLPPVYFSCDLGKVITMSYEQNA